MAELKQRLLNKEMISDLFTDEWYEKYLNGISRGFTVLANKMEVKIRGVKEKIRIEVYFKEVTQNGLVLVDSEVIWSSVKIGEGRQAVIDTELINIFNQEEYYLPNWITENKYVLAKHFNLMQSYRSSYREASFFIIERANPELLLEARADFARQAESLERTQLVLHDGKIYSRLLDHNRVLNTEEEILEFAQDNIWRDSDFILDGEGNLYKLYKKGTIEDLNNIRLLTRMRNWNGEIAPIGRYAKEYFTYREFAALKGIETSGNLPITYVDEREGERYSYENGERRTIPYLETIEVIVFSPRVLGEELKVFKLGDHVRLVGSDKYGIVVDATEQDKGLYQVQSENTWVYNGGEYVDSETLHASLLEKVDKPMQENIGEIVVCVEDGRYSEHECKCIGEVVYALHEYYIVKVPSFPENAPYRRRNFSANYVDSGDGFIYKTVAKNACYYLRREYLQHYELFREQSEQMEWVKNHAVLGTYLYPLLERINSYVLKSYRDDLGFQFEPFILFLDYRLANKTIEQIHMDVVNQIGDRYRYLTDVSLKGIYDIDYVLEKYFTEQPEIEVDDLLELLG